MNCGQNSTEGAVATNTTAAEATAVPTSGHGSSQGNLYADFMVILCIHVHVAGLALLLNIDCLPHVQPVYYMYLHNSYKQEACFAHTLLHLIQLSSITFIHTCIHTCYRVL